jgi:UDP-2,3-diacylglucosamine hydrolase
LSLPQLSEVRIDIASGKKVFFASDFHLGAPDLKKSQERERSILRWLDHIEPEMQALWLLGDIFDFWFEYKHAVPKGGLRLQGRLAELADKGIPIVLFAGNHDLWYKDYFEQEIGAIIYHQPIALQVNNRFRAFVGHGDGLGPGDYNYKRLKKVFTNRFCQWAFERIHPNLGIGIARKWSAHSRSHNPEGEQTFRGEKEWLWQFSKEIEKERHFDYYIFGHRHLALALEVGPHAKYINTGDWLHNNSYAYADAEGIHLAFWS